MYESDVFIQVPNTRFLEEKSNEQEMKQRLVQQFQQPNLITMPGTQIPMYAHQGIELVTLEKVTGIAKLKRKEKRRARYGALRLAVFNALERPRSLFSIIYHSFVFILILVSLFLSIILTMEEYEKNFVILNSVFYMELWLVIVFAIEYILRLWSCSSHGNYTGVWGRLRFIRKPYMVIDIIVIVATVVVVVTTDHRNQSNYFSVSVFRFLRFLQVLRILRLDRQRGAFKIVSHVVYEHRQELLTCWYMSFILLVACAFLVYLAEKSDDLVPESGEIKDLGEGMYFAIITLLTIGYGDYSPKNWVAKLLTCLFAFVGTAFFALPAGILGSGFAIQVAQNQKRKHMNRRRQPAALVIQYAWKVYASHPRVNKPNTWVQHQVLPVSKEKKTQISHTRSASGTPTINRRVPFLRHKIRQQKFPFAEADGFLSRRSSIGATIPSALELRDRCQSDGNLLLVSPHNVENHQHTIVSLPPDYADSFYKGKNNYGLTTRSMQEINFKPLSEVERNAIRFVRKVRFGVAIRKFREECRPYDVKDVIEQYTEGQIEMFGFIKRFQGRLESSLGVKGVEHIEPQYSLKSRLTSVEGKVEKMDAKLDQIIQMLSQSNQSNHHRHHFHRHGDNLSNISYSTDNLLGDEKDDGNRSPRDRRRGMTFQSECDNDLTRFDQLEVDELTQRLAWLKQMESSESLVSNEKNTLQVPGEEDHLTSRFTVTPSVLVPDCCITISRDNDLTPDNATDINSLESEKNYNSSQLRSSSLQDLSGNCSNRQDELNKTNSTPSISLLPIKYKNQEEDQVSKLIQNRNYNPISYPDKSRASNNGCGTDEVVLPLTQLFSGIDSVRRNNSSGNTQTAENVAPKSIAMRKSKSNEHISQVNGRTTATHSKLPNGNGNEIFEIEP